MNLKILKFARLFRLIDKTKYDEKRQLEIIKHSPLFNAKWYLEQYPDVKNQKMSAAKHYFKYGWQEGRNPSVHFDTNKYIKFNPDVRAAQMNPLLHFEIFGKKENRCSFPTNAMSSISSHIPFLEKRPSLLDKMICHFKNKSPFVSIIVASFNYENYIKQTLNSLIDQTYKNFEIIVVDDGSRDNSIKIIKQYVKKHSNIFLYQHFDKKNHGLPETLKLGIEKAKGDYIAFCESDDFWTPDHLEEIIKIIYKYASVNIVANDCAVIGEDIIFTKFKEQAIVVRNRKKFTKNIRKFSFQEFRDSNYITTFSCCLVKKSVLEKCDFNSPRKAALDWWLWRQIVFKYPVYFTNKKLTVWRIHQSYLEKSQDEKKMYHAAFLKKMDDLLQKQSCILKFIKHKKTKTNPENQEKAPDQKLKDVSYFNKALYPLNRKLNIIVDNKTRPVTVNILIPSIRPKLSAGPLSIIWFGKFLADLGYHIRFITYLNWINGDIPSIIDGLEEKLSGLGHKVEVECIIKDGYDLKINSNDMTIATLWSSAYIAEKIQSKCKNKKFIYLIQDFEPNFYSASSNSMLAEATYLKDFYALFSTQALFDYFFKCNIGNFQKKNLIKYIYDTPANSCLMNKPEFINLHQNKNKKRFVFYCRPHIDRNAYDLACLVIIKALEQKIFNPKEWEFYGVGASSSENIELMPNVLLKQLPNMPLEDYKKMLPTFDIALSLMASPHPSMPPIDFALSGCIVVTNASDIKTQKYFNTISQNIIASEPTIDSLVDSLSKAVSLSTNLKQRYQNAMKSKYPCSWDEVFSDKFARWFKKILN